MVPDAPKKAAVKGDLVELIDARRALAEQRARLARGEFTPAGHVPAAHLDRQIAELDGEMAQMILRRAYGY